MEKLKKEVEEEKVQLEAKVKILANYRVAFDYLEERSRKALKTLYEHGLERPLTTDEDGPALLLPPLVKALEEVVDGIGPMAEAEARVLSSTALTRVFSHLHLRDPNACLDELLDPVAEDHCEAAAAAVQGQVDALLKKFRGFASAPLSGDAADRAAGGAGDGDVQGLPVAVLLFRSCNMHQASWRR